MSKFNSKLPSIILATSLLAGCGGNKGALPRVDVYTQFRGVTFVEKFKVWATGPDEVVARDALYEAENYLFREGKVHLLALRGETEAFQLVINADFGNVNDVGVTVSALQGPGGVIPAEAVRVYYEPFIKTKASPRPGKDAVETTDPLVPLTAAFDVAKTEAQPLFVVVAVPADAAPGLYAGDIVVQAKGAKTEAVRLEVEVAPATLEKASLPPAWLDLDYRAISSWYGDPAQPVSPKVLKRYLDFLARYDIGALDGGYSQLRLKTSGAKAAKEWAKAASARGFTFFPLSAAPDGGPPSVDDAQDEYLKLREAAGKKTAVPLLWGYYLGGSRDPWAGKGEGKPWEEMAAAAAGWPGAPSAVWGKSPFRTAPGKSFPGNARYFVVPFADVAACPDRYGGTGSRRGYFLRADGSGGDVLDGRRAGARLLSWYGYLWGAEGIVALAPTEGAVRPANPWRDDPMVGDPELCGNALGQWFYPGEPVGEEGPLPSIRLELWRQGMEDWALLKLAERKKGRPYVRERLLAVLAAGATDLGGVSTDVLSNNQLYELRTALIRDITGRGEQVREVAWRGVVTDAAGKVLPGVRVGDAAFATYTDEAGRYELRHWLGRQPPLASLSGFRSEPAAGGAVKLYRGLKRLEPVFDFEAGIQPGFWLAGDEEDALGAGEEREMVFEGRIALGVTFPLGRVARVVNLYPRTRDFSKYHRFEFAIYNPHDFIVNVWLLLLDDPAAEPDQQFRYPLLVKPRAWTRFSLRTKDLARGGEKKFVVKENGTYNVRPAYRPDLSRVIGVGFETDGLVKQGGAGAEGEYRLIFDDVKLVVFE